MNAFKKNLFLLFTFNIILFVFKIVYCEKPLPAFSKLVVFGDSLSCPGNFYWANGKTHPSGPFYDGRFTDGPLWIEVLAEMLNLEVPKSIYNNGYNFAHAGARSRGGYTLLDGSFLYKHTYGNCSKDVFNAQDFNDKYITVNIAQQVDDFVLKGVPDIGSVLVSIQGSCNDLLDEILPSETIENMKFNIIRLTLAGVKYFVVADFPPLELIPISYQISHNILCDSNSWTGDLCEYYLTSKLGEFSLYNGLYLVSRGNMLLSSISYNTPLREMLSQLEHDLNITIIPVSLCDFIENIYNDPLKQHLIWDRSVIDKDVCMVREDSENYVFFDDVHPTAHIHDLFGKYAHKTILEHFQKLE